MRRTTWAAALLGLLAGGAATASDRIGGFGIIDKVVLEPDTKAPTRAQVWGTFTVASDANGRSYTAPAYGYLYVSAPAGQEETCRKEWKDFQRYAGTGDVVGFGRSSTIADTVRVRAASDRPNKADTYPVNFGLVPIRRDATWQPVLALRAFPVLETPKDGAAVAPGGITLAVRSRVGRKDGVKYVFELRGDGDVKETSAPLEPGDKDTRWTPRLKLSAGKKYTWTVRAVVRDGRGPTAKGHFAVKER
jgi:hypothetical protein